MHHQPVHLIEELFRCGATACRLEKEAKVLHVQFATVDIIILLAMLLDGDVGEVDVPSENVRISIICRVNLAFAVLCRFRQVIAFGCSLHVVHFVGRIVVFDGAEAAETMLEEVALQWSERGDKNVEAEVVLAAAHQVRVVNIST